MSDSPDGVSHLHSSGEQSRGYRTDRRSILEFYFACTPIERWHELRARPERNATLNRRAFAHCANLCQLLSECWSAESVASHGLPGNSRNARAATAGLGGEWVVEFSRRLLWNDAAAHQSHCRGRP